MGASRKAELDESKFGSVTAGMVIRKGKSAPPSQAGEHAWNGSIQDQFPGSFLVRKGEATPSPIDLLVNAVAQFEGGAAPAPQDSDENRRVREELGRLQSALTEARTAAERARESWTRETEDLLLKAKQDFQSQAKQWMAEEARHQEEWTNALAALTARCEQAEALVARANASASTSASIETELARLRDEHGRLQAVLTERDAALAKAQAAHEYAEQKWRRDSEDLHKRAEEAEKTHGSARLAAAQAQWQEETVRVLAEARAQAQTTIGQLEQECIKVRAEATSFQTALKDRESALSQRDLVNGQARDTWHKDAEDALRKAEQSWKAGEAERMAAKDAQWQQQFANIEAQATARSEKAEAQLAEASAKAKALTQAAETRDGELKRLLQECTALLATLSERDAELGELRAASQQAQETSVRESRESQEALRAAESSWKTAEATRLAAAETKWRETSSRTLTEAQAQADAAQKAAKAEHHRLRQEVAALQKDLSEKAKELAQSHALAEKAQETQSGEAQDAFRKAEQSWKAAEAARFSAAEAEWRETSARALTEARAKADAAQKKAEAESGRLRQEVATLQAASRKNANELAESRTLAQKAHVTQTGEAQEALRKTEQRLEAAHAARLAAAETEWDAKSAQTLKEARAQADTAQKNAEDERDRLRVELSALQTALSENAKELAETRTLAEKAQAAQASEVQETLAKTEQRLEAALAERLAAVDAEWSEEAARALAAAHAEGNAARQGIEDERDRLRLEVVALQGALSENADELAKIRVLAEKVQGTEPGEAHDNGAARLAAAEAQWKSKSASALADARARYQAAEAALAQLRAENDRARTQIVETGKNEANSMRLRMGGHAAAAPEKVRLSIDLDRPSGMPETRTARPNGVRDVFKSRDEAPPAPRMRTRDVGIAAVLGVLVILSYPVVAPFLPESVRSTIASVIGTTEPTTEVSENSAASVEPPQQDTAPKRLATVLRDANLRANPSTAEAAIAKLARGAKVAIIEQRGSWTKIQGDSQDGKTPAAQGWVSSTFLKSEAAQQK